jgi:hypothetical protein
MQFMVASGQYMQFLDLEASVTVPVGASELEPNHRYAVLLFLQNGDPVSYDNVTVTTWHDTFEVGVRGLSSLIVQPRPVDVPGRVKDAQGVVMVRFLFVTPSAGRGRLAAKVLPSGPAIVQPVSVRGCSASHYPSDSSQASFEAQE